MIKNRIFIIVSIFLCCLMAAFFIYQKYGKYLPTSSNEISFPHALAQEEIQKIRKESPISSIQVYKSQRFLLLKHNNETIRKYPIRLGFTPIGHKVQEGDGKTPEGHYIIDWRNPKSAFYKSLHISYPNQKDKTVAQKLGVYPGGDIMIHGSATKKQVKVLPNLMHYFPKSDWTWGCIAVRNVDMDEIWLLVDNGTVIEIYP